MVKLKICGLTRPDDARLAADLGADYLGFVFHRDSPRCADPRQARKWNRTGSTGPLKVGVFVDAPGEAVRRIFEEARLDLVQLHGGETPEYVRELGLPAWKALRAKDISVIGELGRYMDSVIVLDSWEEGRPGGTGKPFNPEIVRRAVETGVKIVAAGGISDANIAKALSLRPFGLDVGSSLEASPGRKSGEKMRKFFAAWRALLPGTSGERMDP